MTSGVLRRISAVAVSAATVMATTTILSVVGTGVASAWVTDCPKRPPPSTTVDNNLGASFSVNGPTVTYTFSSLVNEHPSGGVPGLIEYCVFTSPMPDSSAVDPNLKGANGAFWTNSGNNTTYFSFKRPDGNKTNIPFNGTTGITMGTATWNSGVPGSQVILLHINDSSVCPGVSASGGNTCYVFPVPS
ncbi:MAG TPA: hypothetical protein VGS62_10505 [Streptosporangiaceae bacterium]|nr:hypothetical protein [Streptosporangiaceae bacterium]